MSENFLRNIKISSVNLITPTNSLQVLGSLSTIFYFPWISFNWIFFDMLKIFKYSSAYANSRYLFNYLSYIPKSFLQAMPACLQPNHRPALDTLCLSLTLQINIRHKRIHFGYTLKNWVTTSWAVHDIWKFLIVFFNNFKSSANCFLCKNSWMILLFLVALFIWISMLSKFFFTYVPMMCYMSLLFKPIVMSL